MLTFPLRLVFVVWCDMMWSKLRWWWCRRIVAGQICDMMLLSLHVFSLVLIYIDASSLLVTMSRLSKVLLGLPTPTIWTLCWPFWFDFVSAAWCQCGPLTLTFDFASTKLSLVSAHTIWWWILTVGEFHIGCFWWNLHCDQKLIFNLYWV